MAVLLGRTSAGTTADFQLVGWMAVWRFQATASGDVAVLKAQTKVANAGAGTVRLGIYADSAGSPGALLGVATASGATGTAAFGATLSTPVSVTSGTFYWLGWRASGEQWDWQGDTSGSYLEMNADFPNPWAGADSPGSTNAIIWGEEASPLYSTVDEITASDTDYIESPTPPATAVAELGLSNITDPENLQEHVLRVRRRSTTTGRRIDLTHRIMQGTTEIAKFVDSNIPYTRFTTQQFKLDPWQAARITDYTNLRYEVTATEPSFAEQMPWFVNAGQPGVVATGTTVNVPYPNDVAQNDILVVHVVSRANVAITTPTNWALIGVEDVQGTVMRQAAYWFRAAGTESGSLTVSRNNSTTLFMGRMYAFRGCVASGTPFEASASTNGTVAAITGPTGTTLGTNRLGVRFVSVSDDNPLGPFSGSNVNWRSWMSHLTIEGSDGAMGMQTAPVPAALAVTAGTYTMLAADSWIARQAFLIPAATAADANAQVSWVEFSAPSAAPGGGSTPVSGNDVFTFAEDASIIEITATRTDTQTQSEGASSMSGTLSSTDIFTLSEAASGAASISASDSQALSELAALLFVENKAGSDSFTMSELAVALSAAVSGADVQTLSEIASVLSNLSAAESHALSEAAVRESVDFKVGSDSATVSEVVASLVTTDFLTASEAHTMSESVSGLNGTLTATDLTTLLEDSAINAALLRTDTITATELATATATDFKEASDSFTFIEGSPVLAASFNASDSFALEETLAALSETATKTASDSFNMSEQSSLASVILLTASDSATLVAEVAGVVEYFTSPYVHYRPPARGLGTDMDLDGVVVLVTSSGQIVSAVAAGATSSFVTSGSVPNAVAGGAISNAVADGVEPVNSTSGVEV